LRELIELSHSIATNMALSAKAPQGQNHVFLPESPHFRRRQQN
jgi:hypothetical protein